MSKTDYKHEILLYSGGFDPLHSGHIKLINEMETYYRPIIIGVNSDEWLIRKKGHYFLTFKERLKILQNIKGVVDAIGFDDSDNSACDFIQQCKNKYKGIKLVFCNGGDRTEKNIPEMDRFKNDPLVEFKFGVGGTNKQNSSSDIVSSFIKRVLTNKHDV